jgi:hypothetical protein
MSLITTRSKQAKHKILLNTDNHRQVCDQYVLLESLLDAGPTPGHPCGSGDPGLQARIK